MYIGFDIGGTKTFVAALNNDGVIVEEERFLTPKDYASFLSEVKKTIGHFKHHTFKAGGVGMAAVFSLDKDNTIGKRFGNLPWKNVHIKADLEKILGCPIVVENDAKMGGLSEAMMLKGKYSRVLYVAIGTGMGVALTVDQEIDTNISDAGGGAMLLEYQSKMVPWDNFASGRAIVERFGKRASDIEDAKTWRIICRDIAKGLIELIAIMEPDVIVIGGGIGSEFKRYGKILTEEVDKYKMPLLTMPAIEGASRPEQAVIYGCYDLAKQTFGHA